MLELAHRSPAETLHLIDLPYRLNAWALRRPENTNLWFDEAGILRAWAILNFPSRTFDYVCDPVTSSSLHGQILDWALGRARSILDHQEYADTPSDRRTTWYVNTIQAQKDRTADLLARGFADQMSVPADPWSKVFMVRPADAPLRERLIPPGYRVRRLSGKTDVAACVRLHRAVFHSLAMIEERRWAMMLESNYRPELDLVIEAPDSSLAGFCVGWFDPVGYSGRPGGQIEPMGVSEQHRRLGLSKILMNECFRWMAALGAEQIYLETDSYRPEAIALYESVGFRVLHQVHVFRKDF